MASLDFDAEKAAFREYYDVERPLLEGAIESFLTLIRSLLASANLTASKIEGRLKEREECIKNSAANIEVIWRPIIRNTKSRRI